jgi:hypothetical protein
MRYARVQAILEDQDQFKAAMKDKPVRVLSPTGKALWFSQLTHDVVNSLASASLDAHKISKKMILREGVKVTRPARPVLPPTPTPTAPKIQRLPTSMSTTPLQWLEARHDELLSVIETTTAELAKLNSERVECEAALSAIRATKPKPAAPATVEVNGRLVAAEHVVPEEIVRNRNTTALKVNNCVDVIASLAFMGKLKSFDLGAVKKRIGAKTSKQVIVYVLEFMAHVPAKYKMIERTAKWVYAPTSVAKGMTEYGPFAEEIKSLLKTAQPPKLGGGVNMEMISHFAREKAAKIAF